MADTFTLTVTADELEMLVDALEADLEGYVEAAKDARGSGAGGDVEMFKDAALSIQKLLSRLQDMLPE